MEHWFKGSESKTKVFVENSVPVPLCLQIPHGLTWDRTLVLSKVAECIKRWAEAALIKDGTLELTYETA